MLTSTVTETGTVFHACNHRFNRRCTYDTGDDGVLSVLQSGVRIGNISGTFLGDVGAAHHSDGLQPDITPRVLEAQENMTTQSLEYVRGISVLRAFSQAEGSEGAVFEAFERKKTGRPGTGSMHHCPF